MREPLNPYERYEITGPAEGCDCPDPDDIADEVREKEITPLLRSFADALDILIHELRCAGVLLSDKGALALTEMVVLLQDADPEAQWHCIDCKYPLSVADVRCHRCGAARPADHFLQPHEYPAYLTSPTPCGGGGVSTTAARTDR